MINLRCPECGEKVDAPKKYRGRHVKCPTCGKAIRVPLGQELPAAPTQANQSSLSVSPGGERVAPVVSHVQKVEQEVTKCPYCGETILAVANKCKHCGEFLHGLTKPGYVIPVGQQIPSGVSQKKTGARGMAIASMVCSLVGFIVFPLITGIIGIALGASAKSAMRRSGNYDGDGMATAGIVIGIINVILGIIFWFFWFPLLFFEEIEGF